MRRILTLVFLAGCVPHAQFNARDKGLVTPSQAVTSPLLFSESDAEAAADGGPLDAAARARILQRAHDATHRP